MTTTTNNSERRNPKNAIHLSSSLSFFTPFDEQRFSQSLFINCRLLSPEMTSVFQYFDVWYTVNSVRKEDKNGLQVPLGGQEMNREEDPLSASNNENKANRWASLERSKLWGSGLLFFLFI